MLINMKEFIDKKQESTNQKSVNNTIQKKNNKTASFEFADNRLESVTQRKLQNLVTNSTESKKIAQLQTMLTKHSSQQTVQLVLKDPSQAGVEAQLVEEYHAAESSGDAISATSRSISDHRRAISYYGTAKRKRIAAERMHVDVDPGHRQAITALNSKIRARNEKIKGLVEQQKTGKKPKRPSLNHGGKGRR